MAYLFAHHICSLQDITRRKAMTPSKNYSLLQSNTQSATVIKIREIILHSTKIFGIIIHEY